MKQDDMMDYTCTPPSYETLQENNAELRKLLRAAQNGETASLWMCLFTGLVLGWVISGFQGIRWSIIQTLWAVCRP